MIRYLLILLATTCSSLLASTQILVIQGAPGSSEYEERFTDATNLWIQLANDSGASAALLSPETVSARAKQSIKDWIQSPDRAKASSLWIVYQGHGTSNAGGAKLNLPGEDLSAKELGEWLDAYEGELVFIHGGSASAPFLAELSSEGRVIITATRSAAEQNYARFGERFVEALAASSSDIDRDNQVSLLEAFLSASNAVETFYKEAGRLSSEHALIDDNGDGKGTPATLYSGLRLQSEETHSIYDGRLARRLALSPASSPADLSPEQIEERNRLERELETLFSQKDDMSEEDYYEKLERILTKLAKLYVFEDES